MKVAIIGLGNIARTHYHALTGMEGVEVVGLCDINPEKRELFPRHIPFFQDYVEMIQLLRPDCVNICLPHYLHYPVTQQCASMGTNVFVEKPSSLNYQQGLEFEKLEETYGVKIGICYQSRYNATTKQLKKLLASGEYGKITGISAVLHWNRDVQYYKASPWRGNLEQAGGGVLINQAIHTIDLIRCFIGKPCVMISGTVGNIQHFDHVDVEDFAVANLFFPDNIKVLLSASLANHRDEGVNIHVDCETARFQIQGDKLFLLASPINQLIVQNEKVEVGKACYGNSHGAIMADFFSAIQRGGPYINAAQTIENLKIIDGIKKSSEESRAVSLA